APSLEILHFMTNEHDALIKMDKVLLLQTARSLREPGYLLSPHTSVIADSHLPNATLINILAKSPKATHGMLQFDDWPDAQVVLGQLVRFKANARSTENQMLCPRLCELQLDFNWEFSEPSAEKKWLLDALKSRKEIGLLAPLSIYVGWKGDATYVLLTAG